MVKSTSVTSVMELRTVKEATVGLMGNDGELAKGSSMEKILQLA